MNDLPHNDPLRGPDLGKFAPPEVRKREARPEAKPDPAPDALTVHEKKLNDLVSSVNMDFVDQWRRFRDETDDMMKSLKEREAHILDEIAKLIQDARSSGAAVQIFSENLARLKDEFRIRLPKATNLKPNGNGDS